MPLVRCNISLLIDAVEDPLGLLGVVGVGHPITGQFQYDTSVAASPDGSYDLPTGPSASFLSLTASHGITWQNGGLMRAQVGNTTPGGSGPGTDSVEFDFGGADFSVSVPFDPSQPAGPDNIKCAMYLKFVDP